MKLETFEQESLMREVAPSILHERKLPAEFRQKFSQYFKHARTNAQNEMWGDFDKFMTQFDPRSNFSVSISCEDFNFHFVKGNYECSADMNIYSYMSVNFKLQISSLDTNSISVEFDERDYHKPEIIYSVNDWRS